MSGAALRERESFILGDAFSGEAQDTAGRSPEQLEFPELSKA